MKKRLELPKFLAENKFLSKKITKVNVWASRSKTKSKLHYDFYENFLQVKQGRKTVYLWPPTDNIIKSGSSNYELTSHEGEIDYSNFEKWASKNQQFLSKNSHKKAKFEFLKRNSDLQWCILEPGETVYIPEGWWHLVISEPNTLAVNYWLESVFVKINRNFDKISSRLVKQKVRKMINAKSLK